MVRDANGNILRIGDIIKLNLGMTVYGYRYGQIHGISGENVYIDVFATDEIITVHRYGSELVLAFTKLQE